MLNKERIKEYNTNYRNTHKEYLRALKIKWYLKNRIKILKQHTKYRNLNRNKLREYTENHKEENLKKNRSYIVVNN